MVRFWILILCIAMSGCTTPSGQAVTDWFGGSMGRLRDALDPDRLVAPELRRGQRLLHKAPGYPTREVGRSRSLLGATLDQVGQVSQRTRRVPAKLLAVADRERAGTRRRVAHLVAPGGLLRQTLDPNQHVMAVTEIYHDLPAALGLDRQILPGPGDPDRQTVAHPTPPTETWVKKILRRVRL